MRTAVALAMAVSLYATAASAQGIRYDNVVQTSTTVSSGQTVTTPAAGVTITACSTAPIVAVSEVGAVVTATTSVAHGLVTGQPIKIAGVANTSYNGTFTVATTPTSTSFTYINGTTGLASSSGGTVLPNNVPCTPLANVYADQSLTTTASNPTTSDALGNYGFWLASGTYVFSLNGGAVSPSLYTVTAASPPSILTGPNIWTGSNLFTGPLSVTNAGLFDNSKYNQYFTMTIGGCNNQTLYSILNGGNETAGLNACIKVPVGATQRQNDAIAGLVDQFSGAGSPAVAIFGGALGDSANARAWGANFEFYDNGFATPNGYGVEIDADVANAGSIPNGLLITGLWTAQPTQGMALEIAQNDLAFHWPIGLRFLTGATNALDNFDAAIWFDPTSASNNSPSQGINFFAVPSGGGSVGASIKLLPSGILNIDNPANTHNVPGINLNNIPLTQTIGTGTSTSNGTAIAAGTAQAQPAITITGATTTDTARCALNATPPATWQTGINFLPPVVTANTVTPWISNGTAGSITPVATAIRCTVTR